MRRKLSSLFIVFALGMVPIFTVPAKPTRAADNIELTWNVQWGYAMYESWYARSVVAGGGPVYFVAYFPNMVPSGVLATLPHEAVFSVDPHSAYRVNAFQLAPGQGKNSFAGMNFGGCLPGPMVELTKYTSFVQVHVLNTTGADLVAAIGGKEVVVAPGAYYSVSGLPLQGTASIGCVSIWWNWLWLTPSPTATNTPTVTDTPTPSPSLSATSTPTFTPTVTLTATSTPTVTVTAKPTWRVKPTRTARPTRTPRATREH